MYFKRFSEFNLVWHPWSYVSDLSNDASTALPSASIMNHMQWGPFDIDGAIWALLRFELDRQGAAVRTLCTLDVEPGSLAWRKGIAKGLYSIAVADKRNDALHSWPL